MQMTFNMEIFIQLLVIIFFGMIPTPKKKSSKTQVLQELKTVLKKRQDAISFHFYRNQVANTLEHCIQEIPDAALRMKETRNKKMFNEIMTDLRRREFRLVLKELPPLVREKQKMCRLKRECLDEMIPVATIKHAQRQSLDKLLSGVEFKQLIKEKEIQRASREQMKSIVLPHYMERLISDQMRKIQIQTAARFSDVLCQLKRTRRPFFSDDKTSSFSLVFLFFGIYVFGFFILFQLVAELVSCLFALISSWFQPKQNVVLPTPNRSYRRKEILKERKMTKKMKKIKMMHA